MIEKSIRVLIADDHAVTRVGYRQFLQDLGVQAIGEAAGGREALGRLRTEVWDIVLLDIHMGEMTGIEALQSIVSLHSNVRVLVTSALPEEVYALNVMKLGAVGFLPKTGDFATFSRALRDVASGRRYVSDSVAELMASTMNSRSKLLHEQLSCREAQVFRGLVSGESRSSIAARLKIDPKTIGTYRSRTLRKMKVSATSDLIEYAHRHGLRFDFRASHDAASRPVPRPVAHSPQCANARGIAAAFANVRWPAGRPRADLCGHSVLVLEDDFCLARDLQQALQHAGATVLGPYADANDAMRCVERKSCSCAVVDLCLGEGISMLVPKALKQRGIPLLFLTDHRNCLNGEFPTETVIEKPADLGTVISTVARLSLA